MQTKVLLVTASRALAHRLPPSWAPHLTSQLALALLQLQAVIPARLNDSVAASLLTSLSTTPPADPGDDYTDYQRLKYRPPTQAALRAGLGSAGHAALPFELWTSHHLPLTLPPHPPTPFRAPPPSTAPFFDALWTPDF